MKKLNQKRNVGYMIYLLRKKQGLTQGDLALLLGVTQANLSLIEHGRRLPQPKTLERIASALKVSPEIFEQGSLDGMQAVSADDMIRIGAFLLKTGREQKAS